MYVLIACEESQAVCKAFRERGHQAYSCDLQECSGGHPEWHIHGDCFDPIKYQSFETQDGVFHLLMHNWDLIIAHPPCTDLAVSGARWFKEKQEDGRQQAAIDFFMKFTHLDCPRVAIENPVCIMSSIYRKPDQIIQPFQFGHAVSKRTCLWLKGLPKLKPTDIVELGEKDKYGYVDGSPYKWAVDENGKVIPWNDPRTAKIRSKTFSGIAKAMAEQWG